MEQEEFFIQLSERTDQQIQNDPDHITWLHICYRHPDFSSNICNNSCELRRNIRTSYQPWNRSVQVLCHHARLLSPLNGVRRKGIQKNNTKSIKISSFIPRFPSTCSGPYNQAFRCATEVRIGDSVCSLRESKSKSNIFGCWSSVKRYFPASCPCE